MTDNNPDARKPLILIAEDVESNYKLLEIILKKEYELLWAKNGKEAVDYALERHPDAVLMDIKMPVMDGIEALKEIRRHTTQLPVIMQTAYAFDTDRRIAEEAGCNGFITKPVMPRVGAGKLRQTCRRLLPLKPSGYRAAEQASERCRQQTYLQYLIAYLHG